MTEIVGNQREQYTLKSLTLTIKFDESGDEIAIDVPGLPSILKPVFLEGRTAFLQRVKSTLDYIRGIVDYKTPNSLTTLNLIYYTLEKYFSPAQNQSERSGKIEHQQNEFQKIILDRFKQNPQFIIYNDDGLKNEISSIGFKLYSIFSIDPDFAKKILKLIEIVVVDEVKDNDESTPTLEEVRGFASDKSIIDDFTWTMTDDQKKEEFLQFVKDFKNKITIDTAEKCHQQYTEDSSFLKSSTLTIEVDESGDEITIDVPGLPSILEPVFLEEVTILRNIPKNRLDSVRGIINPTKVNSSQILKTIDYVLGKYFSPAQNQSEKSCEDIERQRQILKRIFYALKKYFSPAQNQPERSGEDIEKPRREFQKIILDRFEQNPRFIIYYTNSYQEMMNRDFKKYRKALGKIIQLRQRLSKINSSGTNDSRTNQLKALLEKEINRKEERLQNESTSAAEIRTRTRNAAKAEALLTGELFALENTLYSIFSIDPDFAKKILKLIEIIVVADVVIKESDESTPTLEKVRGFVNNPTTIYYFARKMNTQLKAEFLRFAAKFKEKIRVVTPKEYKKMNVRG